MPPYALDTHSKSTGENQEPVHPGAAQSVKNVAGAGMFTFVALAFLYSQTRSDSHSQMACLSSLADGTAAAPPRALPPEIRFARRCQLLDRCELRFLCLHTTTIPLNS